MLLTIPAKPNSECFVDPEGELESLRKYKLPLQEPARDLQPAPASSTAHSPPPSAAYIDALLLQLLFAHAYDRRTTFDDRTIESGWTVAVLCPALCFLADAPPADLRATQVHATRRSLTRPLYRSFALAAQVWADVRALVGSERAGERVVGALRQVGECLEEGARDGREDPMLAFFAEGIVGPLLRYLLQSQPSDVEEDAPHLGEEWAQARKTLPSQGTLRAHEAARRLQFAFAHALAWSFGSDLDAFKRAVGSAGAVDWDLHGLEEATREDMADGLGGGYV